MKPTHCSGIRVLSPKPHPVTSSTAVDERYDDIRHTLLERRRELLNEIQSKVRDIRELGSNNHHHSADLRESVEADPEDDLAFALIQMRAETLENVNEAILRFDEVHTDTASTVMKSSRRPGSERCPSQCVVGIAQRRLRTNITARASNCSDRRRDSTRDSDAVKQKRGSHEIDANSGGGGSHLRQWAGSAGDACATGRDHTHRSPAVQPQRPRTRGRPGDRRTRTWCRVLETHASG